MRALAAPRDCAHLAVTILPPCTMRAHQPCWFEEAGTPQTLAQTLKQRHSRCGCMSHLAPPQCSATCSISGGHTHNMCKALRSWHWKKVERSATPQQQELGMCRQGIKAPLLVLPSHQQHRFVAGVAHHALLLVTVISGSAVSEQVAWSKTGHTTQLGCRHIRHQIQYIRYHKSLEAHAQQGALTVCQGVCDEGMRMLAVQYTQFQVERNRSRPA